MGEQNTILDRWGITASDLTQAVDENPSLRGMLFGYVAEIKLKQLLEAHPHITATSKHDDHDRRRKSDREVVYRGRNFTLESKSLQTNSVRQDEGRWTGKVQVDASDRRNISLPDGTTLNTTLLLRGEFDVLAVNCFAFGETWRWAFALNRDLPTSRFRGYTPQQQRHLIASLVNVTWPLEPPFVDDPIILLERLYRERSKD